MRLSYEEEIYNALFPKLSTAEKNYIRQFKSAERQYEALMARLLLKNRLGAVEVSIDSYGKPFLINQAVHISIAHCRGFVLIGYDDFPIGVDLEPQQILTEPQHFLHALENMQNPADAIRFWTMKEAYVKFLGHGFLQMEPQQIHCLQQDQQWRVKDAHCYFDLFHYESLQIAVAKSAHNRPFELTSIDEQYILKKS